MIPKVIHYCWFGGQPKPSSVKKCINSWRKYCPDYEIMEWNEKNMDINSHPFMKEAYNARAWAYASDVARLKIIYEYGGVYLDTDVELIHNLDFLLQNEFYIGKQQAGGLCTTGLGFGAEQYNFVVKAMLDIYTGISFEYNKRMEVACPALNNKVIRDFGYIDSKEIEYINGMCVLPCRYLDPFSPGNNRGLLCSDTISIHHYLASWEKGTVRLKRRVLVAVGPKIVYFIKRFI